MVTREAPLVEFWGPSCFRFVRRGHVFLVPSSARQCTVKGPGAASAGVGVVSMALGRLHPW